MAGFHGRQTRVVSEGTDLSGFLREASIQMTAGAIDATPFNAGTKQFVEDFPDARATISGYYDPAATGTVRVLLPRYGRGVFVRHTIMPLGFGLDKMGFAFQGIITSFNQTRTVSDVQAMQMDTQIVGELYVTEALTDYSAAFTNTNATRSIDRNVVLTGDYKGTTAYSGLLYIHTKNTTLNPITVNIRNTNVSGAVLATTGSLAVGTVFASVFGTFASQISMLQTLFIEATTAPSGADQLNVYAAIVDPNLSLLNK